MTYLLSVTGWGWYLVCRGGFKKRQEEMKNRGWKRALNKQASWSYEVYLIAEQPPIREELVWSLQWHNCGVGGCFPLLSGNKCWCYIYFWALPTSHHGIVTQYLTCLSVGFCLVLTPNFVSTYPSGVQSRHQSPLWEWFIPVGFSITQHPCKQDTDVLRFISDSCL